MTSVDVVTVVAPMGEKTAGQMCLDGDCSPLCMLAMGKESRGCYCPCGGFGHGMFAHVRVKGTRAGPPRERVDEPALFDIVVPELEEVPA